MQYIKKQIEIGTSGHINECWVVNFENINLVRIPETMDSNVTVNMTGFKSYADMQNGKHSSDSRTVTVTSSDLQLNRSIGYDNIPKFYEVITTKTVTNIEIVMNELGEPTQVESQPIPAYPDFFGGEIVDVV